MKSSPADNTCQCTNIGRELPQQQTSHFMC